MPRARDDIHVRIALLLGLLVELIREIGIDYAQGYLIGAPAAEIGPGASASRADAAGEEASDSGANVVSISERRQNA